MLKGHFLEDVIKQFVGNRKNWRLETNYHFGGYAKYNAALIHFINRFKKETTIQLDPLYTGKMAFGILDMIKKNTFPDKSNILMIHTGGLQGIKGFNHMLNKKNKKLQIIV